MKRLLSILGVCALAGWLAGCQALTETVGEVGATVGEATGTVSPEQAESIRKTSKAVAKTFEDITPEQEYYIGRAVAATVLHAYKVYDKDAINHYLNVLGQGLSQASEKPETFGGYHFITMDSAEINAFAAPGGPIMISRGLIECCRNEDELAAVLAHEISHVQFEHGLKAIKQGRLTSALTILATESAKSFGGKELASLTEAFEGSITDITSTLMTSGYSRGLEYDADKGAVKILKAVGYNPKGLTNMLAEMAKRLKPGGHDFAKTHPAPQDRIKELADDVKADRSVGSDRSVRSWKTSAVPAGP
ncbi:MAG: M48 family metalloprotease [Candidatus Aureabacteria bacterium]|nr:M48 family metalloprotease [Candidatus Auribacterota bacterium]